MKKRANSLGYIAAGRRPDIAGQAAEDRAGGQRDHDGLKAAVDHHTAVEEARQHTDQQHNDHRGNAAQQDAAAQHIGDGHVDRGGHAVAEDDQITYRQVDTGGKDDHRLAQRRHAQGDDLVKDGLGTV